MFDFIHTLYQTEPYDMSVQLSTEVVTHCKLSDSLSAKAFPLFQFQGYQDLYLLSRQSAGRRAQLFTLSPLGGHPHNWAEISKICLTSLDSFTAEVLQFNVDSMRTGHNYKSNLLTNGTGKTSVMGQIVTSLQQRKTVGGLFHISPDAAVQQLLSPAQKHIWNICALSNLVIASYTEDTYGVVQKSLGDVITSIVKLRDEVEKMCKLGGVVCRQDASSDHHSALRVCLKSALYSITSTFASHLYAVELPAPVREKLRLFVEYKV